MKLGLGAKLRHFNLLSSCSELHRETPRKPSRPWGEAEEGARGRGGEGEDRAHPSPGSRPTSLR